MGWKKYRLLGAGSYGAVYLARKLDPFGGSNSFAAVKSSNVERSPSLRLEGNLLKELRGSPYIIQCFGEDISMEKGRKVYNLLLEYAPGGTLHDLIKSSNGGMQESVVAIYCSMLLNGLSYMHRKGVIHCDIKPSNILVFPFQGGLNHLKIADLGVSKRAWDVDVFDHRRMSHNRGTPIYASPESVYSGIHQAATDIWSLGCTILEMITGRPVWTLKDDLDLMSKMRGEPEIPDSTSESAKDFLRRCFERDPSRRWTADMLLNHPFIVKNIKPVLAKIQSRIVFQINPFGSSPWIHKEGLFSTSLELQHRHKPFPENRPQVGGRTFISIPCGATLIGSLAR